jgi:hypothetical protein
VQILKEIGLLFQFSIGLVCGTYFIFFPYKAQENFFYLLKSKYGRLLFFTRWGTEDERHSYMWRFRFVGVICYVVAAGAGWVLFRQLL